MICDIIGIFQNSIIVKFNNAGMIQARIISRDELLESEPMGLGSQITIDKGVLFSGTEYGIDVATLTGGECLLDYTLLTNALRVRGVWTPEDFASKPNQVQQAVISMLKHVSAKLYTMAEIGD